MKILCVIDSLGSGGAQRQLVNLSVGLKERGHEIELLIYGPDGFFRAEVEHHGIFVHEVRKNRGFSFKVLLKLMMLMRCGGYSAVISYLDNPNLYCEIARVFSIFRNPLIVSERNSHLREKFGKRASLKRAFHFFATKVVANSESHSSWLKEKRWLRNKTSVIYNGYKIHELPPMTRRSGGSEISLLAIGRVDPQKNGVNLVRALDVYQKKHGGCPKVAWVGRQDQDDDSLHIRAEMNRVLALNSNVASKWQWLGERSDMVNLLEKHDALIHVSWFEGLPNAICEAFVAGRPVIASNVCDHPLLLGNEERGFLCDPASPQSICEAIERFSRLTLAERERIGLNARAYAEAYLNKGRMVLAYERLILDAKS